MVIIYGGANCRGSQRARRWLAERNLSYQLFDIAAADVPPLFVPAWIEAFGWPALIDKRRVAWRHRALPDLALLSPHEAQAFILRQPHILKSPIIYAGGRWLLGWNAANKILLLGYTQQLRSTPWEHDTPSESRLLEQFLF